MLCENPYEFIYNPSKHSPEQKLYSGLLFPCGKCLCCIRKKTTDWKVRILMEAKSWGLENCCFITLTFNPESIERRGHFALDKRDAQLFIKRLRINAKRRFGISHIRYYICGEYGSQSSRPHYHAVIFGLPSNSFVESLVSQSWNFGFVKIGTLTERSAAYVAGYSAKHSDPVFDSRPSGSQPEFHLQSLGLGKYYIDRIVSTVSRDSLDAPRTVNFGRRSYSMPKYIVRKCREKLFSTEYIKKLKYASILNYIDRLKEITGVFSKTCFSLESIPRYDFYSSYLASVCSQIALIRHNYRIKYLSKRYRRI